MKKTISITLLLLSFILSANAQNEFYFNGSADVIFRYPPRGVGGRAFVHADGNVLSLNFGGDFTGGTRIGNDVFFKDNGNSYIYSGNLGIGTSNPIAKLHVSGDGYSLFGPNSTWGAQLRVGGNGNVTNDASVVATNGNLHLDGAIGDYGTYINYYHGSAGVLFGNGAQSIIGTISGSGNLTMNGTGTFGTNTLINGQGDSYLNGGNVGVGITTVGVQTKFHVKEIGSSANMWKGRIVASGDNSAVVMGERNGKAWLGGHNAALSAWSDLILQADGGNIGIGTQNPDERLTVNGVIHAKEVKVDLSGPLADFVFKPNYKLMSLPQVEQFVKANNHLPQMPSAEDVAKNGLSMGEMQNKLLQKVEELTLYVIEQQKTIAKQQTQLKELNNKFNNHKSHKKND